MNEFSKEYFKKLANQIMFDLSDDEVTSLQSDFELLVQQMGLLDNIDTSDVKEMVYPFETPTSYLREDEVSSVISKDDALANAPKQRDGMIVVPKVVK